MHRSPQSIPLDQSSRIARLIQAYHGRCVAYLRLKQFEDAMADAVLVTELSPNTPTGLIHDCMLNC